MMGIKEIGDIVSDLNVELWDDCGGEAINNDDATTFSLELSLCSNGSTIIVDFCGIEIWNDDQDDRLFDEHGDHYVPPLYTHLRRKVNRLCALIGKVKLTEVE
ncbi:MAG: hypothetical protein GY847_14390 [Proteobacteria bacterium]|nr:hypothetical protein [Pseudomonadota bacterium]